MQSPCHRTSPDTLMGSSHCKSKRGSLLDTSKAWQNSAEHYINIFCTYVLRSSGMIWDQKLCQVRVPVYQRLCELQLPAEARRRGPASAGSPQDLENLMLENDTVRTVHVGDTNVVLPHYKTCRESSFQIFLWICHTLPLANLESIAGSPANVGQGQVSSSLIQCLRQMT